MNENELAKEHYDLVKMNCAKWDRPDLWSDLESAGSFGLLRAIRSWRGDREAGFKTYAGHCIRNAQIDFMRKQKRTDELFVSLTPNHDSPHEWYEDEYVEYGDDLLDSGELNPEEELIDKEQKKEMWHILLKMLPTLNERQRYILRHRIHCEDNEMETQAEIADIFKCNQSTIQREEKRIYVYLREKSNVQ